MTLFTDLVVATMGCEARSLKVWVDSPRPKSEKSCNVCLLLWHRLIRHQRLIRACTTLNSVNA